MAFRVHVFDNVEVLEVGVTGPGGATRLFLVCGVAVINFPGLSSDWTRDDVHFIVPAEGTTIPVEGGGTPLDLGAGNFVDSTVIAFPATFTSSAGDAVGWGVDSVDSLGGGTGSLVEVHANVAVNNTVGQLLRMGFQVNILAR